MCKKVVIPYKVDAEMIKQQHHSTWDKIHSLMKKSAIKNEKNRDVVTGVRDWDAYLEGKDIRHEYIFADFNDLSWAVNTLKC